MNGEQHDDGEYDLAPEPAPVAVKSSGPAVAVKPVTLAYRRAPVAMAGAATDPETYREFKLPLLLLVVGMVIEVVAALMLEISLRASLTYIGINVLLGTAIMLVGVLIAARLRGIALGPAPTASLKLAAVSVAPGAVVCLLYPALRFLPFIGGFIGWGVSFVLYFALLGALFELDESDTWYCVWTIFVVRLAAYFALTIGLARWM